MTNEELTRIYCEANGLRTNEFATITTERVFAAMRAAMEIEREACANVCEPKTPRPCDCDRCDCGNSGDLAAVVDWDAMNALAAVIRGRGNNG